MEVGQPPVRAYRELPEFKREEQPRICKLETMALAAV